MTLEHLNLARWAAKRAARVQRYHDRMTGGRCGRDDPRVVKAWLAAVERDDSIDPHGRDVCCAGGAL